MPIGESRISGRGQVALDTDTEDDLALARPFSYASLKDIYHRYGE